MNFFIGINIVNIRAFYLTKQFVQTPARQSAMLGPKRGLLVHMLASHFGFKADGHNVLITCRILSSAHVQWTLFPLRRALILARICLLFDLLALSRITHSMSASQMAVQRRSYLHIWGTQTPSKPRVPSPPLLVTTVICIRTTFHEAVIYGPLGSY